VSELGLPRCYDNTVPFFIFRTNSNGITRVSGVVTYTQG